MSLASENSAKVYIFRRRYEQLYYFFLACALLFVAVRSFDLLWLPSSGYQWLKYVVVFLFFNYLHLLLGFLGLIMLPELRAWLKSQFRPRRFAVPLVIVSAILCLSVFPKQNTQEISGALFTAFLIILISMHNLGQTKGLALMYNRIVWSRLSADQQVLQQRVERVERWFFNALLAGMLARALMIGIFNRFMNPDLTIGFAVFNFAAALMIVLNSLRYPELFKTNKFYFLQGVWLFALVPMVPIAVFMQMAMHGLEYAFLADVAYRRSAAKLNWKWIVPALIFLVIFSVVKSMDPRLLQADRHYLSAKFVGPIVAVLFILDYLHYYLDSIMFQFKDPNVRAHIAPFFSSTAR